MAVGFGGCDNHLETIESTINNGIDFARSQFHKGMSSEFCEECGDRIPEGRRKIMVVHFCVKCQSDLDKKMKPLYNRRGSKDSQLR
ncbi:putative transcriptional regulator [Aeromonas phage AS-yj]|uniref:DksA-like zinc-finger protein n=5 Tax=Caudoviricetes TaxID=2731619 RepID=A0AB39TZ03_9CAUD|nr:DksA-like zinc-finger protein [Aeromonas phage AS-zj]YP_009835011.1 DksA-like zinc-finger protein [Aeromonas phage AS-sw]ATI17986.1 putative transcriptional regulator [Aeromonas phage AS-yj]QAX97964.1 putative transcriptional regulator [Aeromonas phage Asswx_1]QAX98991.1 putative transcriptional regulator [Aeromonas phage Assk]ASU00474.1 putative transcriptional regulator [Aeromonas phage AS-zj]ATI18359.1 putative transcriptional regulator [Aeromonas phage AS-sw]